MKSLKTNALILTLLTSSSTLLCCALPALLVLLGAGSTIASLVTAFPQLVWLSEHKIYIFYSGAFLITLSGYWQFKTQNVCPTDPQLAEACRKGKKISRWIWGISLILYLIGFSVTFILPLLL